MVLLGRPSGRVGRRRDFFGPHNFGCVGLFLFVLCDPGCTAGGHQSPFRALGDLPTRDSRGARSRRARDGFVGSGVLVGRESACRIRDPECFSGGLALRSAGLALAGARGVASPGLAGWIGSSRSWMLACARGDVLTAGAGSSDGVERGSGAARKGRRSYERRWFVFSAPGVATLPMPVASKRLKISLAAVGLALAIAVTAFGPLVRHEISVVGARYGATVAVGKVWPTWRGVRLKGIDVGVADVPSASIHIEEIEVAFGGEGRKISVRGGHVHATGPRELLLSQVEAWRARNVRPAAGATSPVGGSRDELDLGGFSLKWQDRSEAPSEAISATGVRLDREGDRLSVVAETALVQQGSARAQVTRGLLRVHKVEGAYRVDELSVGALDGSWTLTSEEEELAALAPGGTTAPAASASAAPIRAVKGKKGAPSASVPVDVSPAWERRAQRAAGSLVAAAKTVDALLEENAKVVIDRIHAEVRRGSDVLHVGPGRLAVTRDAGRLSVELAPWVEASGEKPSEKSGDDKAPEKLGGEQQALTFRLLVPVRQDAASQEIVGDVRGGPIWLSTLGVREGDFGLFEVGKASVSMNARVTLSAAHDKLRIEGDGRVGSLSLSSKALSDEPLTGLDLAWRGKVSVRLDRRHVEVDEGEVDLGQIRLLGSGTYDRSGDDHRMRASFDLPLVGCQAALESLPKGLASRIHGLRMAGTFALKGKVAFDTARIERDFLLSWDTAVSCRVTEAPPSIDVSRFTKAFERTVYTPEGMPKTIETGPGTATWAPYGAISRFMTTAVLTTEDGGFYRHRGFDAEAIRNSLRENLKQRRFVRGASTVSMQLAKNLYLDRQKSVSRKLQEAVLTMYLEQVLTKDQIMELYLNVIELGPMVYGVGPAAQHYFHADAGQLSLGQALYLSSILPAPKVDRFLPQGPVRPSWMSFLHKLMEIAHKRDRITDEELEEGLRETVVRGSPAPFRAPKPAEKTGADGDVTPSDATEDPGWTAP